MKKMETASLRLSRGPAFPFGKAELVDEGPSMKGSENAHQVRCGALLSGVAADAHPWGGVTRSDHTATHHDEGLASFNQHSFNINKAHSLPPTSSWIQQMQSILPMEGYTWSGSGSAENMKNSGIRFAPYNMLNAGSLVLDSSRGELVNALKMTPKEILEAKALAASRSHSEAERRRRERINTHLATLRTIVPGSIKSDKASLLAEVIDQVKRLKRQVSDVYCYGSMPSECDELVVEGDPTSEKGRIRIRVSLCCDDRPDLMADLKHALDTLKLCTLKVEMSTLGGRMKNDLLVAPKDDCVEYDVDFFIKRVQEALRLVMERPGRGELLQGKYCKRQRVTNADGKGDC
ncbi:hypothetical protein GOP47_0018024 [Adiantum capillus-veneris]|uniref:BHLH domain-containing protein n=1 Tax=Adiantum capillus-veneris TaxID=13818 RepID=A0A9D4ZCD6_ADICA|nr:hypothetical protein GOP47_0018024 [Adiantum capillus-veneris]